MQTIAILLFSGLLGPTAEVPAACRGLEPLLGSYRYAGGDAERSTQRDAIEQVVAGMAWVVRPIARHRLTGANPIPEIVELACRDGHVDIRFDDRTYSAPLDGRGVTTEGLGGGPVQLRGRVRGARLVLSFEGQLGGKEVVVSRSAAGRIRVTTRVFSPKLPEDVTYDTTYAEIPAP